MSGVVSQPSGPTLDFSGASNPLQDYFDQISALHDFTGMVHSTPPAPMPVGTETVQSVGMPSAADNPLAYWSGSRPVMQSDLDRAHAQVANALQVAPTMVLGMVGDAPGGNALSAARSIDWTPARTGADYQTVWVDPAKLDAAWQGGSPYKETGQPNPDYVGPGGAGGVGNRYANFGDYLKQGGSVEQPQLDINPYGEPQFVNGRHRFAYLRDQGAEGVPVTVPAEHADTFEQRFGTDARSTTINAPPASAPPPGPPRIDNPLIVYHGTPHLFAPTEANPLGAFDLAKIGTGEGAQVYGHGIYAAENEATARSYRDALARPQVTFDLSEHLGDPSASAMAPGDVQQAMSDILKDHPALEHIDERTIDLATQHVVQGLAQGQSPAQILSVRTRSLGGPDATEAIQHALAYLEGVPVDTGGPKVGGEPFDIDNLTHKAAWYVAERGGGDPDKTLGYMANEQRELEGRIGDPDFSDVYHRAAIDRLQQMQQIIRDQGDALPQYVDPSKGHMYQAEVHAAPEDFLHWDLPFSKQSPQVQDALVRAGAVKPAPQVSWEMRGGSHVMMQDGAPTGVEFRPTGAPGQWQVYRNGQPYRGTYGQGGFVNDLDLATSQARYATNARLKAQPDLTGQGIYESLVAQNGLLREGAAGKASQQLRDAGIPGIRYLDQGSRSGGQGTHNIVSFDPATINIIRRYGIGALIAGGGAGAAAGAAQPQ